MAARSTNINVRNKTGINLKRTESHLDHGAWSVLPPEVIAKSGSWGSESDGFATGTEGGVTYELDDAGEKIGVVNLSWDNPFVGSNSYTESVQPAANDQGEGFSIGHFGGDGNNAAVTFVLLNGRCTVDGDTGETICVEIFPLQQEEGMAERYAAIFEQSAGGSWRARHGLTSDQYQRAFDELTSEGFRLTDVSGYSVAGEDHYAAIWVDSAGPPFQARHGLTADQYQQTFDELVGQGFRPTVVSGYDVRGEDRFAAIFEQREGPPFQARHGLTADQYQQTFDELVGQGFRPTVVSGYGVGGQDRFAAIFEQREGPPFQARHGLTADQYQQTFDDLVGQGFRLTYVAGYNVGGEDRYAAIFDQSDGPAFQARHGLSSAEYQRAFDELVAQGFRLTHVSGYSVGS